MAAGVHAVQQSGSDLGVVLDTDVDRSAVVARDGQPINSNRYIALMSLITLRSVTRTVIPLQCQAAVCIVQTNGYFMAVQTVSSRML